MKMVGSVVAVSLVLAMMSGCAMPQGTTEAASAAAPASRYFDPARNATADVDAALAAARVNGKHVLLILGGDWCHDSIALADLFHAERFAAMLAPRYELVWVHVPRASAERDTALARRFGLERIEGTPTVLILNPAGQAINLADAPTWRNAAARKPAAIYRHFARAVPPAVTN